MRKTLLLLILCLMLSTQVFAENEQVVTMKTNERITATYQFKNIEGDTLKVCYPYFSGELRDVNWVTVEPYNFDLAPGDKININVILDRPPKGYYQDIFQISCDRYVDGQFLERVDTISPSDAPVYSILVSEAGAGQDFVIKPADNTWRPVIKAGTTETVPVTIANTGSVPLIVDFTNSKVQSGSISVDPVKFTLPIQSTKVVALSYTPPSSFDSINESFKFFVGDYEETFAIAADSSFGVQSIFSIGTFSLIGGNTSLGGLKIPNFILTIAFLGFLYYYIFVLNKESKFTKSILKRFKRKQK